MNKQLNMVNNNLFDRLNLKTNKSVSWIVPTRETDK